ncbi:MAG: hypothetical protein H6744_01435 [Deltaproteobacteria bacterium]|nr:hypothetical protein [Deltaproteobacteria bacterium]
MESVTRTIRVALLGAAAGLALTVAACGGGTNSRTPGTIGGACFAGGACESGLVCRGGTCQDPSSGDVTTPDAEGDGGGLDTDGGAPDGAVGDTDGKGSDTDGGVGDTDGGAGDADGTVGDTDGGGGDGTVGDTDGGGGDGTVGDTDGGGGDGTVGDTDGSGGDGTIGDGNGGDGSGGDGSGGDGSGGDGTIGDGIGGDGGPGDGSVGDGGPNDTSVDGADGGNPPVVTNVDCTKLSDCTSGITEVDVCASLSCNTGLGKCVLTPRPNGLPCDSGDACIAGSICIAGTCQGGKVVVCDDDNECTDDACDAELGCTFTPNTAPCSDGNTCTDDICGGGKCVSTSAPGACDCFDFIDCLPFDDGDPCTGSLTCDQGQCVVAGSSVVVCDTSGDGPCSKTACSPQSGLCVKTGLTGPVCDDGDPCTENDACSAGFCEGTESELCACDTKADCAPLEDGDLCNGSLQCVEHQCILDPATVKTCTGESPSVCEKIGCDPLTGTCGPVPKADGVSCDDGDSCTEGTTCSGGTCGGGVGPDCDDGDACTVDTCDELGGCVNAPTSGACDDGNACTKNDTCALGSCAGEAVDCNDDNPCTEDACNPASGCTHTFNTVPCDDGKPCTEDDACALGVCTGKLKSCDDGNPCTTDLCNETGGCTALPIDGTACSDQDACTVGDTCDFGVCKGIPKNCDDSSPCTKDACDPAIGCTYAPQAGDCNDLNACTFNDVCDGGGCAGTPLDCDDGNACTFDSCNPLSGCKHDLLTGACDDGDPCTEQTTCQSGSCVGVPVFCNDGNPCTDDFCDPIEGCATTFNTASCDDQNACTVGDKCVLGVCKATPKPCSDSDPCTVDGCVPSTGNCEHLTEGCECTINGDCITGNPCKTGTCVENVCFVDNATTTCNDGNACTIDDACVDGVCAGALLDCDDENPCTLDSCDKVTGCAHVLREGGCDDGDACTFSDVCTAGGVCEGQPLTCDDDNPCTDDLCDTDLGCVYSDNAATCDDGDACTLDDKCTLGKCKGVASTAPECGPPPEPCTFNWKLTCNESHSATLEGGQAQVSTWPSACFGDGTGNYSGPEFVYKVTATCTGGATATVTRAGGVQGSFDVAVMKSKAGFCSTDQCIGGAKMVGNQAKAFFDVEDGVDYFVAVDGRNGAVGDFSFAFQCDCEPLEGGTCGPAAATLACNTPTKGDTALGANGVSSWKSCVGLNDYAAPEVVYDFVAPCDGQQIFTLTRDAGQTGSYDLLVLDGAPAECGPDACVQGALMLDGKAALSVSTQEGETVRLVVDGFAGGIGKYTLTPTCNCGAFETDCTNQEDDDADGDTDCEDSDCVLHPNCKPPPGECQPNLTIECNQKLLGTNAAGFSNVNGWENCAIGSDYSAPENVYAFKPPCDGDVIVRIDRDTGLTGQLTTVVMDQSLAETCGPPGCITSALLGADAAQTKFAGKADQGYFIAVDGLDGATGPYELRVDCGCVPKETECFGGVDDDNDGKTDCDDTDCADVVPCVVGDICTPTQTAECNQTVVGNTASGLTEIDAWNGCSVEGSDYGGKEQVWSFTPTCNGAVKVKLTNDTSFQFVDLIVLDGSANVCTNVECVTATFGSDTANEAIFNAVAGRQYFLAVDGSTGDSNGYELGIDCTCVPFETDCANLFDDDGDNDIDCLDSDCEGSPFCTLSETTCAEVLNCVNGCAGSGTCIQGCTTGANEQVLALYETLLGCIIDQCFDAPGDELQACIEGFCPDQLDACTAN